MEGSKRMGENGGEGGHVRTTWVCLRRASDVLKCTEQVGQAWAPFF
jgi:hypothetical protein